MSIIRVQAAGQEPLDRAARLLAGIDGGIDKAMKRAMSRAVSHLRSHTVKAIQERYAISAGNIRANENVHVRYTYQNGVQAIIHFSGSKIPLYRYDGASPRGPAYDQSRLVNAIVSGEWRKVHPGIAAAGHVLKSTSPVRFENGFVASMRSGHTGIFERSGGMSSTGGDEIKEIMGLSVAQMLGHETVGQKLAEESMDKFEERLDHEILALLNGWG